MNLLAFGYKDIHPDGVKSGIVARLISQLGIPKDVGRQGDKIMSSGNVPTSIKQPLSSTSSIPVSKRLHVATTPMSTKTTCASEFETQRVQALPPSGVSSRWVGILGQQPQAHNQVYIHGSATTRASSAG